MFSFRFSLALAAAFVLSSATSFAATDNDAAPATKTAQKRPVAARKAKPTKAKAKVTKLEPMLVVPTTDVLHEHHAVALSGWVTGPDGMPLPGATVWLTNTHGPAAVTNRQGDFLLALPTNAPVSLTVGCAGYENQTVMLNQPHLQNGVSVALRATAPQR